MHNDRIDASRFEANVAAGIRELHEGRFDAAAETLGAATSLWRGQPPADAGNRAFAQPEIVRLEGSYRAARLARVQADVQRGLHRAVIGELAGMADAWPDDEMASLLLVICLYRSGRSAEAARACRAAIEATLEHGLDPRRLTALQLDVLSGSLPSVGLPHMPSDAGAGRHSRLSALAPSTLLPRAVHTRVAGWSRFVCFLTRRFLWLLALLDLGNVAGGGLAGCAGSAATRSPRG